MRKICVALLSLVFIACMCLVAACGSFFTVTFDGNGGTLVEGEEVQTVKSANDIVRPKYEREGYDFVEWDIPPKLVTESCTIKAQWKMWSEFTITLDPNGGTFNEGDVTEIKLAYEENVPALPMPAREDGYSFDGWKIGSAEDGEDLDEGRIWDITKNVTAYAVWIEGEVNNINWSLDGGKVSGKPQSYKDNATVDLSQIIPTKTGYTFKGWNIDGDKTIITEIKHRTGEITLVANWKANEYTISFDKNGLTDIEDVDCSSITVTYDGIVPSLPSAKKTGRILSWSKDGSEDNIINNGTKWTTAENITLYAIWKRGDYEIHYELNGGKFSENTNIPYYYNRGEVVPLPSPTKSNRNFSYWREVDSDGNAVADRVTQINSTETGDRYFVAVYVKNYNVTLSTTAYESLDSETPQIINYLEGIKTNFSVNKGESLSSNLKTGYQVVDNYRVEGWAIVVGNVKKRYNNETINDEYVFGIKESSEREIVLYPILEKSSKTYTVMLSNTDIRSKNNPKVINYLDSVKIEFTIKEGNSLSGDDLPTGYQDKNDNYKIVGWIIVVGDEQKIYNGEMLKDEYLFGTENSTETKVLFYPMLSNLWIGPY